MIGLVIGISVLLVYLILGFIGASILYWLQNILVVDKSDFIAFTILGPIAFFVSLIVLLVRGFQKLSLYQILSNKFNIWINFLDRN